MTRLLSILTLFIFTWTTLVQAFPLANDFDKTTIKDPSLKTWNEVALVSKIGFETLDAVGSGVEKVASLARQSLRTAGVSADTAQDSVYVINKLIEAYTFGKGGASLASKVSNTASTVGKTKNVALLNTTKIGALDDITLGRSSNSNLTRVNQFDRMNKTQRAPANQTPLTHNQTRATGTHGTTQPDVFGSTPQSVNQTRMPGYNSAGSVNKTTPIVMSNGVSKTATTPIEIKSNATAVPPALTPKYVPEKDGIPFYVRNEHGRDIAVAIKGKETQLLDATPKTTKLVEGAEEAAAAARKHWAREAANKAPYNPRAFEQHLNQTYGAENVTSSTLPQMSRQNVKLAGKEISLPMPNGETVVVPFDTRGYVILDKYSIYETRIADSTWAIKDRGEHFKEATKCLKQSIMNGEASKTTFNDIQLQAIMKEQGKIPGLTWHHDLNKLQLVPETIHNHPSLKHVGGFGMHHPSKPKG